MMGRDLHMLRFIKVVIGVGLIAGVALPTPGQPQTAAESVDLRLQTLLVPSSHAPAIVSGPVAWPAAKAIEKPQMPLSAFAGLPPQPVVPAGKSRVPRSLPEEVPVIAQAKPPQRVELPTQPLIQLPSADVDAPLPVPILARPKQDRAALDDATMEASQAAALERVRSRRMEPVPFAPVNLPDPFENIRTGGLHHPPAEQVQPPAVPIRTPAR
jgi:hypothetical protein